MSQPGASHQHATDPAQCRQLAEDISRPDSERIVWALLGILGELHELRRDRKRVR